MRSLPSAFRLRQTFCWPDSYPGAMPLSTFPANEALAVLRGLAAVDHELGPGRDLYYEIETTSGQTIQGLIVALGDDEVTLVDERTPDNDHNTVSLSDVVSVHVRSYT